MATTREDVQKLLDAIPDERLSEVAAVLEPLLLPDVPEDDEPVTDEDLQAIAEARAERIRGETIPHGVVRREMGW